MNVLELAAAKFNINPILIFCYAYHFSEIRIAHQTVGKMYVKYSDSKVLPIIVYDYCLDLLAGRISLPDMTPPKLLRRRND
jgi:hypothetical protein